MLALILKYCQAEGTIDLPMGMDCFTKGRKSHTMPSCVHVLINKGRSDSATNLRRWIHDEAKRNAIHLASHTVPHIEKKSDLKILDRELDFPD